MKTLLALVPTYNEAPNIRAMVCAIRQTARRAPGWRIEVLVIDDHSPDGTAAVVRQLQAEVPGVHLLEGPRRGLGRAYVRGFRRGLRCGPYDAFLMIDADFSHRPEDIPLLLCEIDAGADCAIGSRYIAGGSTAAGWPLVRGLNSRLANTAARLLLDHAGIADLTAGFKVIRRSALARIGLEDLRANGYVFQVSLHYALLRAGADIREVPIVFENRRHGASKLRLRDVAEFVYRTSRLNPNARVRRLARFCAVGLSGTVVNLLVLFAGAHVLRISPFIADGAAIEVSIISNFFWNHLYTFRSLRQRSGPARRSLPARLLLFNVISLGGAVISFGVFSFSYTLLGLPYLLAGILGISMAIGWNYWLSVRVVWRVLDV